MGYTPKKFTVLGLNDKPSPDKPTGSKPFALGSQGAVDLLESIMPSDKAQAVPYVLIWEIDPATGKSMHPVSESDPSPKRPLSIIYVEPAKFGSVVNDPNLRFRERPPVSLERVSVKTENPRGIILYKLIELSFVVHRPDVVFDQHIDEQGKHVKNPDQDSWSSLVTPGEAFALEYGWSASTGVKNGILTGDGFADPRNGVAITGRQQVRFQVTSYTFQIGADSQIRFLIKGIELGESGLRSATLIKDPNPDTSKPFAKAQKNMTLDPQSVPGALDNLLKKLHDEVGDKNDAHASKKKTVVSVPFGKLIDVVFADVIEKSFTDLGFEFKNIFVGCLNTRAGTPALKYSAGSTVSSTPISDFTFPLDDIIAIFRRLTKAGAMLTVYNFLEPFMRLFADPKIWDRSKDKKDKKNQPISSIPEIIARTVTTRNKNGKIEVYFYIFDAKTEFTKFVEADDKKLPDETVTRTQIKKVVNDAGIPFVSLVRANSYIEASQFDTIQDDLMAAIYINRYFGDKGTNRAQKVGNPTVASKQGKAPPAQQIFSPIIQGSISMLGNFVLDTFGVIWLDFGVSRWDGPFQLDGREDVIESGKFITTLRVHSCATDPLGTKSRKTVV